jgi:hypothetical protein
MLIVVVIIVFRIIASFIDMLRPFLLEKRIMPRQKLLKSCSKKGVSGYREGTVWF